MRLTIALFTGLMCIITLVGGRETYLYEKQNFFGLGRRLMPNPKNQLVININSGGHPEPLPTVAYPANSLMPSRSLYQGVRGDNDTRVFRRRFEYIAKDEGQQILCEGLFDCYITFLAVESTEAIPIILRGGVGYRHFSAVVKAKPGRELKGHVRAYCRKEDTDQNDREELRSPKKRFEFDSDNVGKNIEESD